MSISILNHTEVTTSELHPSRARPLRLVARDLEAGQHLQPHSHDWGQLTYLSQGMLQVTANTTIWQVPPMRAIWIPAHIMHEVKTLSFACLRVLHIDPSIAQPLSPTCQVLEVSPLLRELIAKLAEHDQADMREQHLVQVILDEIQAAKTLDLHLPMPSEKRLKNLCARLLIDPACNDTLEQLAAHAGASVRTLNRLFQQELAMSFNQWRQQMRLSHASALIEQGKPLRDIATELGYASQSAFTAMFKKSFGVAPTEFFNSGK